MPDFAVQLGARGYRVELEEPPGADTIGAGCGQLWQVQEWIRSHPERVRRSAGSVRSGIEQNRRRGERGLDAIG